MSANGKELLLADLEEKPQTMMRDAIIKRVILGFYSDFSSYSYDLPALMLVEHLGEAEYDDLKKKAKDGLYDHDY